MSTHREQREALGGYALGHGDDAERAAARTAVRAQLAFYGSTPAYRPVLELHGWEDLGDELNALSTSRREDKWEAMAELVDDEVLGTFAVVADPEDVAPEVLRRYEGVVDRFSVYSGAGLPPEVWDPLVRALA